MHLVDLSLESAGVQTIAQLLEPVHHVLGKAAPVIAAVVLPAAAPLGGNLVEDRGIIGVIGDRPRLFSVYFAVAAVLWHGLALTKNVAGHFTFCGAAADEVLQF
jgi:hypothetical protein